MQDQKNNNKYTTPSGTPDTDHFLDALAEADDVIAQAIRRREAEEAIAETDRAVAELAEARRRAAQKDRTESAVPEDSAPDEERAEPLPDDTGKLSRPAADS